MTTSRSFVELRALIFDFDGTIADTEAAEVDSVRAVFEAHGAALDHGLWQSVVGSDAGHGFWVPWLEDQVGPVVRDDVLFHARSVNNELLADLRPLPGVVDLLTEAADAGIAVAIASSAPLAWVDRHIQRLQIDHHFVAIRARDHVEQAKPAPDLYLSALETLGISAQQAIAIEDSRNGSLAARAAGLRCVVVPNSTTAGQDISHANAVLASLVGVTLSQLLAMVA